MKTAKEMSNAIMPVVLSGKITKEEKQKAICEIMVDYADEAVEATEEKPINYVVHINIEDVKALGIIRDHYRKNENLNHLAFLVLKRITDQTEAPNQ